MNKKNIVVLCTGNSCRSQMAEAFFNKYGSDRYNAYSAGIEPHSIHPNTIKVLEEVGFDWSDHTSKHIRDLMKKIDIDILITVCSSAKESCPTILGVQEELHWPFQDPAAFEGSEEESLAFFRKIRDQIESKVKSWLNK
ncbi:MAG: arsenate reductase ArsC [Candidatus Lokiarchaeota archaeon]|jgi:arsenate reductase|nr:arsenate reductase ArsC [Candidatus Lokiarchaeota archaeon]